MDDNTSRAAFEASETEWCEEDCPSVKQALLERNGDTYTHGLMRVKWKVWQASRQQTLEDVIAELSGMTCNNATARSAIKACVEAIAEMK